MGNDQGNVPLIVRSSFTLVLVLFCLVLLTSSVAAGTNIQPRCGFAGERNVLNAQRLSAAIASADPRPSLQFFADAPSGKFRVHFDVAGVNAVPVDDINGNELPDYVEEAIAALDSAWRTQVNVLGYIAPPWDNDSGGSAAIDVYLRDLSKENQTGLYGVARFGDLVTPKGPWDKYTAYIEIDNDFSSTDRNEFDSLIFTSTNGVEALRVTCAHELHHVIQMGSYGFAAVQLMFYELTSTWMEQRVFPEIFDWHTYTSSMLRLPEAYPFSRSDALNGYVWGWFGWALAKQSDTLLRHAWDVLATGERPLKALTQACSSTGTSLSEIFCSALPSLYFTGSRSSTSTFLLGASELPEIRLDADERARPPSSSVGGALRPFEVRAIRFSVPGTSDRDVAASVLVSAPNETAFINGNSSASATFSVLATNSPVSGDIAVSGSLWGLRLTSNETLCSFHEGFRTTTPEFPYPQPYRLSLHNTLRFPVPSASIGDQALVAIRSVSLGGPLEFAVTVELDGNRLVAPWHQPADIGTGIYIAEVTCAGRSHVYKIVVRR